MKKLAILLLVIAIAATAAAAVLYERTHALYRGFSGTEQFVEIPTGAGSRTIGERLVAAFVEDRGSTRAARVGRDPGDAFALPVDGDLKRIVAHRASRDRL